MNGIYSLKHVARTMNEGGPVDTKTVGKFVRGAAKILPGPARGAAKLLSTAGKSKKTPKPLSKPYKSVPRPATPEEMYKALNVNQREQINTPFAEGAYGTARLDIPAYLRWGVWVDTLTTGSKKDKITSYRATSAGVDPDMSDMLEEKNQKKAEKIKEGAAKSPFVVIKTEHIHRTDDENYRLAQKYLNDPEWAQVGYNPEKHAYFFDRKTDEPVIGGDEYIQVGPLVLVKNPVYTDREKFRYAGGGGINSLKHVARTMNEGGPVDGDDTSYKKPLQRDLFKQAPKYLPKVPGVAGKLATGYQMLQPLIARETFGFQVPEKEEAEGRSLLILGCCKTKEKGKGVVPAEELYSGPMYRALRQYREQYDIPDNVDIAVLSAKHGLIGLDDKIEDYDVTFEKNAKLRNEMAAKPEFKEAIKKAMDNYGDVFVAAGETYRGVIKKADDNAVRFNQYPQGTQRAEQPKQLKQYLHTKRLGGAGTPVKVKNQAIYGTFEGIDAKTGKARFSDNERGAEKNRYNLEDLTPFKQYNEGGPVDTKTVEKILKPVAKSLPGPLGVGAKVLSSAVPLLPAPRSLRATDETNRMQRAKEMGFDTEKPAYHGTLSDFEAFEEGDLGFHFGTPDQASHRINFISSTQGVDNFLALPEQEKQKMGTGLLDYDSLAYFKGANIKPVYLNIQNPLEMRDVGEWKDPYAVSVELMDTPVGRKYRKDLLEIQEEIDQIKYTFEDQTGPDGWQNSMEAEQFMDELRQMIKAEGYDSVKYRNAVEGTRDSWPYSYSYIALDPSQIRSVSAKFDPEQKESADILAAAGGGINSLKHVARRM
jgi:hypothetical protein